MNTVLRGTGKEITIGSGRPFVIIGEKINPTGNKKLAAALSAGDFEYVSLLASRQAAWGADVLDVNVGVPGMDEPAVIKRVIAQIGSVSDLPLSIDSSDAKVLTAGLEAAPGKPLINSVNGDLRRLDEVLPLAKARGAAVIGLAMDEAGVPATPEGRLGIAERILAHAARVGLPAEDVIIDPLVLTVGSDSQAALVTLQAIELIKRELEVNINLGVSNVSFGLPERPNLNQAFLILAIQAGATCAIADPMKLGYAARAAEVLLARDAHALRYIKYFRAAEARRAQEEQTLASSAGEQRR
jgi:5-methyltetrahydrofolate--homocysteine methyltransferase